MSNNFNIKGFDTFEKAIVDFTATWCGPCNVLTPILDEVTSTTDIKVFKIDVDENQDMAIANEVRSIPTMLYFKRGELIYRTTGVKQKNEIIEIFN